MSVVSKVKGFFSRHRNKFIIGGVIIGGSVLLTRYAQQKLKEWQEQEMTEFIERSRKQQHFENIGRTCNQTIINLNKSLNEAIANYIDTEEILNILKRDPGNKLELWNKLKVQVFSKACCTIYATAMFVVTFKMQLSIIGGYLYKDQKSLSTEMQERYLKICQEFMNSGLQKLTELINIECKKVIEPIDLTKELKLSDLEALFWSVQVAVATNANNPLDKLRYFVIPEIPNCSGVYEKVVRDTIDLLESDEVKSLITHCINRGFLLLVEQISEFYNANGTSIATCSEFSNPFDTKKPLAKLLPIIKGLFAKNSFPDMYLQQLITYGKLQILSANIYESLL